MNDVLKNISLIGISPVIALDDAAKAVPLARALEKGGLPAAEITFRTAAAEESIRILTRECPEVLVGAGTVTTPEQADRAIDAGAKFIVTPGFDPELVKHVNSRGVAICPGTETAGEMQQAMALGIDLVKFFPSELNGGIAKLKSLAGPFRTLNWMPTGGVNAKNLAEYMSFDQVAAVGGTWIVKKDLIANEKWDEITALCREAVRIMLGFQILHVGINSRNEEEARKTAGLFAAAFDFPMKENGRESYFAGSAAEIMKYPGMGTNGHIAIGTRDVERAMYHLGRRGIEFDESTIKRDAKGRAFFVYLKGEFGGFAIHLKKI